MKKILFFPLICMISVFCLLGCDKEQPKPHKTENAPHMTETITEPPISGNYKAELFRYDPIKNIPSSFQEFKTEIIGDVSHNEIIDRKSVRILELDKYDKQEMAFLHGKTVISFDHIQNKFIVKFYPDAPSSTVEIGIFDPAVNEYKKIEEFPFSASYGKDSFVIGDRYYVTFSSYESSESLTGYVRVYDIETDELSVVDEFKEYNIVQFATPIGDDAFAYLYYEDDTQNWVMKYYDLISHECREIFRHTNFNKNETLSPMALAYDGENIVLALQYIVKEMYKTNYYTEKDVYKSCFLYLNTQGELRESADTDLNCFLGDYYEFTDLTIKDGYYFLSAIHFDPAYGVDKEISEKILIILKRSDNEFIYYQVPHSRNYNIISNDFLNKESLVYESHYLGREDSPCISDVSLNDKKVRIYEYPFDIYDELDDVELTRMLSKDDLFVLLHDKDGNYKYQIVDFRSATKKPFNYYINEEEETSE